MSRYVNNTLDERPLDDFEWVTVANALDDSLKIVSGAVVNYKGLEGGSVYAGLGGVAFILKELAQANLPSTPTAPKLVRAGAAVDGVLSGFLDTTALMETALQLCQRCCTGALAPPRSHITFLMGRSGILALAAVLLKEAGRLEEAQQHLQVGHDLTNIWDLRRARGLVLKRSLLMEALEALYESHVCQLPSAECELLYGRSGYLYSLLYVERAIGGVQRHIMQELVQQIFDAGVATAAADPGTADIGLFYQWHGKPYLGAAHGLTGVLHTLLLQPELLDGVHVNSPPLQDGGVGAAQAARTGKGAARQLVYSAASALVELCFPSGNLPSALGSDQDKLVHWCHGSPGLVPLLVRCYEVFDASHSQDHNGGGISSERSPFLAAACKAADDIWQRGLLNKGVGLCHGISGNAYAFLALYRATGDPLHLTRAQRFGLYAAQTWRKLYSQPDRPTSLFEGLCGAVCLWVHLLQPKFAHFPAYELRGRS